MHEVSRALIAAGGNRHPSAADVDLHSGLVAFGAGRNIALWRPDGAEYKLGIETLLSGHTDVVNAVKFLPLLESRDPVLLSGSADSQLRIWKRISKRSDESSGNDSPVAFTCLKILESHEKPINAIAVLPQQHTFVSGAADSTVKVWRYVYDNDDVHVELVQTINMAPKYLPLCVALTSVPASHAIILAVAGSRPSVQIFVSHPPGNEFKMAASLSGHEGWIRSLDFCIEPGSADGRDSDLLLASASQDKYIRLWRFHKGEAVVTKATNDPLMQGRGVSLSNRAHTFEVGRATYSITFEALLLGHEDWIYNARWCLGSDGLRLLSASADNSLAIWQADLGSGVWTCAVRLGEISAQKGATTATGSTGGFWIGLWYGGGKSVLSLGRTGGWRLWDHNQEQDTWTQGPAVGGHTKEVTGLAWAKDGSYLLSTSLDQTTRMYAPVNDNDTQTWHELSRPQIHGYDLNCIDTISNTRFISGADEKLLRVFDEPKPVADLLSTVCGIAHATNESMPEAANIPVLGLSNKVIDVQDGTDEVELDDDEAEAAEQQVDEPTPLPIPPGPQKNPPLEDHLSRHLLWPETEKLYGHGYEISAVASSNNGRLVATACRASSIDHAVIRLFRTNGWQEVKPNLKAHSLTVTRLQFSQDDALLLSIGRDRQCALFARPTADSDTYVPVASDPKAHARMLLDASWAPLLLLPHDTDNTNPTRVFATAGRDKTVHIWTLTTPDNTLAKSSSLQCHAPVTAVAFHPRAVSSPDGRVFLVLACGLDDGTVFVKNVDARTLVVGEGILTLEAGSAPSRAVMRLAWRPRAGKDEEEKQGGAGLGKGMEAQLAVASEDCSVRILNISVGAA